MACQQIGPDNIVDIGKITALPTVAKNGRTLSIEHEPDELGNHGGILRSWMLARTEDVEVAQTDCLKSKNIVEAATVQFAGTLGYCVRRVWIEGHVLLLRQRVSVAIDGC